LPEVPDSTLIDEEIPRHYWRSVTYDHYYGQGWSTSGTEAIRYEAGVQAINTDVPFYRLFRQDMQMIGDWDGTVYVDGKLVSLDEEFVVYWRPIYELFAATAEAPHYRANSLVAVVTDLDLRAAEGIIPDWVQEHYLQLPDDLPLRVRDLALELTATEPTAYDRAKTLETYLRQFPYTLDVETPPYGMDIADYFLFELQEGYCDYYATSMVVLARAAGLPARLVIGYASGNYDPYSARYIVTEADAHAWVEIYFPEVGWIEFEPTGGYPAINRSPMELEDYHWPAGYDFDPLTAKDENTGPRIVVGTWLLIGVGGTLGLLLLYTIMDSVFLLIFEKPEQMITRLYHRLQRYRRRLRARSRDGQTPYEVADSLAVRLDEISKDRELAEELLPDAAVEIRSLADLYVRAWYTPHPMERAERRAAVWTWWVLRWRLWLAWLWRSPRRERAKMPAVPRPLPDSLETQRPTM
jgi:transglutaminase-like putative cysteine protease